jgi:hypothetical protein
MARNLKFPRRAKVYGMSPKKEQGPGSVRYVGSTVCTLKERLAMHLYDARKRCTNTVNCMLRAHQFAVRLTVLEVVTVSSLAELRKLENMYMDIYHTRGPGGWNMRRAFRTDAQKKEVSRVYYVMNKEVYTARANEWYKNNRERALARQANNRDRRNELQRARYAAKKLERETMRSLYKPCMIYPGFVME